ncbi:TPA: hypothetical protein HA265_07295 [Candidatus Woesearchaeota archaeon]|nr:hypothetical protein [Candidatus Woesearchaeota archaeon]
MGLDDETQEVFDPLLRDVRIIMVDNDLIIALDILRVDSREKELVVGITEIKLYGTLRCPKTYTHYDLRALLHDIDSVTSLKPPALDPPSRKGDCKGITALSHEFAFHGECYITSIIYRSYI